MCAGVYWQNRQAQCIAKCQAEGSAAIVARCNEEAEIARFQFLEQQAVGALQACVAKFAHPVFPCALIAGDVVILHLMHKHGLLDQGVLHLLCRCHTSCLAWSSYCCA
jgi:hypothetical protein